MRMSPRCPFGMEVFGVTVRIMIDNELARLDVLRDLEHHD
jgi:hypothetical protein